MDTELRTKLMARADVRAREERHAADGPRKRSSRVWGSAPPKMDTELHTKLMARAGRLLGRRDHSRADLRAKLERGIDPAALDGVLDRLEDLGLLNDANYAYNFGFHRLTREGWGLRRVREDLLARRVAPQVIDAALERVLEAGGEDEWLRTYVERYSLKRGWPKDRGGIHRLVQHLGRRGFSSSSIYGVLRRSIEPAAWQKFESGD